MKKAILIVILALFSCKSGKQLKTDEEQKSVLLYYSKGPCLGKCPVYDLWIFVDGTLLYKGIDKVMNRGEIKVRLTSEEIGDLAMLLGKELEMPKPFRKIRDLPITTLISDGKEYEYHASKIEGSLKEINSKIENLVLQISKNQQTRRSK